MASESSSREPTNFPPQIFGEQAVMNYGKYWYVYQQESKYLGDKYVYEKQLLHKFPHTFMQR